MFDKVKEMFKPKCSFCNNKAVDAFVELKTSDGVFKMQVCGECEYFFEKSARVFEEKDNDKT